MTLIFFAAAFAVFYTYIGYPVLIGALARLRAPRSPHAPITPRVTLLIVAYNEEDSIAVKIENSLALDYPRDRFNIVVVSDGSTDATPDIARAYAHAGVILEHRNERRGKTAAINRTIPSVRGEIVVLSDANNLYAAGTLRALVAPFADPSVGAVCGNKHILQGDGGLAESEGLYWRFEGWLKSQETRVGSTVAVLGEALALRRELFEPAPTNIINDDFYIAMRILRKGKRVVYAPNAASYERVSVDAHDEVVRRSRMFAGVYQALVRPGELMSWRRPVVCWQLISHKYMRPLVPLWLLALLASNVVLATRESLQGAWTVMLACQIAFYALALYGRNARGDTLISKALHIPTFLLNSNFASLIGLYRFSTGRQSTQWTRLRRREMKDVQP